MKKSILFLLVVCVQASCSDDEKEMLTVERTTDDYQPNTVGSSWDYISTDPKYSYTLTITKHAKKLGGKIYFQTRLINSNAKSFYGYRRKEGNNYFFRESSKGYFDDGEYIFLKDAAEGTTWTELVYNTIVDGDTLKTIDTLTIIETGGSYLVNGTTFNNVIVVKTSSLTEGRSSPIISYDYYSKGVGLIKTEFEDELIGNTELLSYNIVE